MLAVGLFLDTRPPAVVPYPHAAISIAAGQSVEPHIEWRDIPAGVLPSWQSPVVGVAIADVSAGSPLLPGLVTQAAVPAGWWSVSLRLPHAVAPGTRVRVSIDTGIFEGIVVGEAAESGFELLTPVAFASDDAAAVATAAASNALVVMVGS